MMASQILVSFILIACGFLVKMYPNLIAGYNIMSQAEKDKVKINAISLFLKQLLIGLGVITILLYLVLNFLTYREATILYTNTTVIVIGVIIGLIYVNTNKKFKN